jgi:NADP-dependent 3-hydroxy acid dehydrogenase YdfG
MAGALEGRRALITGGSSGIGEATAVALAAEGAAVALGARRKDRLDQIVKRIEDDGGKAIAIEADVGDEEQAKNLVATTVDELGGLDILVNNAGVMLLGLVYGADTDEWRQMLNVNCLGLLYCTHEALPVMGNSGGGHIVNVASVAGRNANAGSAVYNMTKFGVVAFSEALRQEALNVNIRVTCVEPGWVDTELQGHNTNPMVLERMEEMRKSLDKVLSAEDIANAVVFAVSQPEHVNVNEVLIRPTGQAR